MIAPLENRSQFNPHMPHIFATREGATVGGGTARGRLPCSFNK
jgi:hypothetical protein